MTIKLNYYTQRQWDRVVGIGKVPKEYQQPDVVEKLPKHIEKTP
tara:strand:- start:1257 stop:1388 length:132 start_codon:yes stop_codon:yes gene_type:complete